MANTTNPDILYTIVDEAPELASASLLPVIRFFSKAAGVHVGTKDISLAGRIISAFPEQLTEKQRQSDDLASLGNIVKTKTANVIKLPNISASLPQLLSAISELQDQGYKLPNYPEAPKTNEEKEIQARYDAIKGSAVNPVLREGNSDRRAARAVKNYAMANPHSMGTWSSDSKTHVSFMTGGDFYSNEKSATITSSQTGSSKIEFIADDGTVNILKDNIHLEEGTVVDATFMSSEALRLFLKTQIVEAKNQNLLFSVHLKATMMKVSDPIIFGHAVTSFFEQSFQKHNTSLERIGANPNLGLGDVLEKIASEPEMLRDFEAEMNNGPKLYMVDSDRGITNLHVPSDVIIDASMPALIRAGGKGWGPDGNPSDTKCVIPDSSYAPIYDETIKYFRETGALDPKTSGAVANVGLMAQKAEEYGSHPTTFEIKKNGVVRYILENDEILHEHKVKAGDIWRSSTAKKAPIIDWINLAITRQKETGSQSIFWLDENRPHDAELIKYVKFALEGEGLTQNFLIMAPREATRITLETIRLGQDSIAITGNVLRDYLTDLFPILELGTSAKMLSVVKLLSGGGLFETGAGGSAPKHVQQLKEENHLRWDSLGEFCALGESLNFLAKTNDNPKAAILGKAVETATQELLDKNKSPSRKVGEEDNRTSHFYFSLYWARALAKQKQNLEISSHFETIAKSLEENENTIVEELMAPQGKEVDLGGYYHTDPIKVRKIMRPSETLNQIIP
ncbi:MAG: NADP-dependent isocitrate dehydrogenase [Rhodobacteraceae bacterium]|nr:NADP-dependent isocitrate dehydrogenase [Paracoccaceae bacterium]